MEAMVGFAEAQRRASLRVLTGAVEKVHQDIMHKPIEVLELIVPDLPLTKTVAEVQTKIIGIVYDVIRGVNHAVGEMADGVLRTDKRSPRETT